MMTVRSETAGRCAEHVVSGCCVPMRIIYVPLRRRSIPHCSLNHPGGKSFFPDAYLLFPQAAFLQADSLRSRSMRQTTKGRWGKVRVPTRTKAARPLRDGTAEPPGFRSPARISLRPISSPRPCKKPRHGQRQKSPAPSSGEGARPCRADRTLFLQKSVQGRLFRLPEPPWPLSGPGAPTGRASRAARNPLPLIPPPSVPCPPRRPPRPRTGHRCP